MGVTDGYIIGTTKVIDNGPAASKFNIVIMGDGYRSTEINKYHSDVQAFLDTFFITKPYDQVWCAINVFRIDVVSTDSGADDPGTCADGSNGTGATPATYFDATFCSQGIRRLLTVNDTTVISVSTTAVPHVSMRMVIVNTPDYGGSGGTVATFSTHPKSVEIGLHEMGHTAFNFADEYEYLNGCGMDTADHNHAGPSEPMKPNVTLNTNRATIKWGSLVLATTNLPTTANANCTNCDPQPNPVPDSTVGAFEGANYVHCGCYRPQYNCRMRALGFDFCAVCQQVIVETMQTHLAPAVTLTTPSVSFVNIPEGLGGTGVTTYRAVVFEVIACRPTTFSIVAGPTGGFGTPLGTSIMVPPATKALALSYGRVWLSYTSIIAGSTSSGNVTIRCNETGEQWTIAITANTVPRPKTAVGFVFDHSFSMSEDAGDGTTKVQKLREAANIFVNVMLSGDGIGIVRFDDTAQILMPVTDVGIAGTGTGRVAATNIINSPQLDPAGNTSIGDGVLKGKQDLDAAVAPAYDVKAMLVLTDGMENIAPMLAAVGPSITANTFAVGLGLPGNISTAALTALCSGHNGYLLVTGSISPDQTLLLTKYFLQILAGITNADIVLDPVSILTPGAIHRIPFMISEADIGMDVLLISPNPELINFALQSPDGDIIGPVNSGNITYVAVKGIHYYRVSLPAIPGDETGTHGGQWQALLDLNRKTISRKARSGISYSVVVHAYSNLNFDASASQSKFEAGAEVLLNASLKEYSVPVEKRANVWAEVSTPSGTMFTLPFKEINPGTFQARFNTSMSGLYSVRVRAYGKTFRDSPFTREKTLTAYAIQGGDNPNGQTGANSTSDNPNKQLCELLSCLLSDRVLSSKFEKRLLQEGIDLRNLKKCLGRHCK